MGNAGLGAERSTGNILRTFEHLAFHTLMRNYCLRRIAYGCCAVFILLVSVLSNSALAQQKLPRAGRDFAFGIIEGPDNLPEAGGQVVSILTLTVLSPYSGSGSIISPLGFSQTFTFRPNIATILMLPDSLMHLNDLGKTNKGLLVHTSAPVNLVLHDYAPAAGDATQILPNEALDTSYMVAEWGLYDDPQENNHCQFIITAKNEGTIVTVTPSVATMLGQSANKPFTIVLNAGECYIVKSDTSDQPISTSLSGSIISSTQPVSVIVGTTCGYVPLGVESCNEIMDELLGKKWWGEHFFVQALGNHDSIIQLMVTSDQSFSVTINDSQMQSSSVGNGGGNQLQAQLAGAGEIVTTAPAEVQQLTRGSEFSLDGVSDPTLVTILDTSQYANAIIFNSPQITGAHFEQWAPIIFPTAQAGAIQLDGLSLSNYPQPSTVINGSSMSAINPSIGSGVHTIYSPVPVFALGTGFDQADAYSFIAGTIIPPQDTSLSVTTLLQDEGDFEVSAFPNPATDLITIFAHRNALLTPEGDSPITIQLVDQLGRILKTVSSTMMPASLDVRNIASGSYFVLVNSNGYIGQARIAIIR
jgi:hypothetical protein